MTGIAKREEIPAFDVMRAGFERGVVLDIPVDPAAHEDVLVCVNVSLDLLQAFVDPVNTVATVDHRSRTNDAQAGPSLGLGPHNLRLTPR
jgi:hypothetical protein